MPTTKTNNTSLLIYLYYLSLIVLSLGQFSALSRSPNVNIYAFDIVLGIFCVVGLTYYAFILKSFKLPKHATLFLGFSLIAAVSLIKASFALSPLHLIISIFYLVRWLLYLGVSFVVYNMVSTGLLSKNTITRSIFYSALFISVAGFIQLIILPDFSVLDASLGWDPHKNRLASVFFDPNFAGAYLAASLTLFLGSVLNKEKYSNLQWLLYFIVPLIALFLTFSRSSWAMFATVIFIFGLTKSRSLLLIAFLAAFLAYFSVPRVQNRLSGTTDPADSAAFRIVSWENTIAIAQDNLLLGVGYNSFKYAQKDYGFLTDSVISGNSAAGSDSSFLLILATTGLIGFLLFCIGFFASALSSTTLFALLSGLFILSQFINALFYPQLLFFWLIIVFSYPARN